MSLREKLFTLLQNGNIFHQFKAIPETFFEIHQILNQYY